MWLMAEEVGIIMPWLFPIGPVRIKVPWDFFVPVILIWEKWLLFIFRWFGKGINDKARERAIVVHGANYADPAVLKGQQRLGRSLGCPALPPDISKQVIDTIKGGVLLYIYGLNKA